MHCLAQYTWSTHECLIMKEIIHESAESWDTSAFRSKYRDGSFQETESSLMCLEPEEKEIKKAKSEKLGQWFGYMTLLCQWRNTIPRFFKLEIKVIKCVCVCVCFVILTSNVGNNWTKTGRRKTDWKGKLMFALV